MNVRKIAQLKRWAGLIVGMVLLGIFSLPVFGQGDSLSVTMTSEDDLGFDCPVRGVMDPSGSTYWVLMNDCGVEDFYLLSFGVGGGAATNDESRTFASALAGLDGTYDDLVNSIAFTPDGAMNITYADEDYNLVTVSVDAGAEGSADTESSSSSDAGSLIADYSEYPETAVFNADHTQAVATSEADNSLQVLDLQSGTEILAIEIEGDVYNAYPSFSADGQQLYITQLHNPEDMSASASTLYIYSLPDGELLNSYEVLSPFVWVSPNGQYAVLWMADDELAVVELATDNYSQPIQMFEEERHATTCLNTGADISDVNFTVSGRLTLMDVDWLPDSSGFITLNSYRGEAAEGDGGACILNTSRLRHYTLGYE